MKECSLAENAREAYDDTMSAVEKACAQKASVIAFDRNAITWKKTPMGGYSYDVYIPDFFFKPGQRRVASGDGYEVLTDVIATVPRYGYKPYGPENARFYFTYRFNVRDPAGKTAQIDRAYLDTALSALEKRGMSLPPQAIAGVKLFERRYTRQFLKHWRTVDRAVTELAGFSARTVEAGRFDGDVTGKAV